MTRSSQPVSNTMHNAPFPENDDCAACSSFSVRCFHFWRFSTGISRPRRGRPLPAANSFLPERDPGSVCRHGPSRAIAVMGRHEQFRSELAADFEAQKKKTNLDGDVLLSVLTEGQTSASWSTAAATGRCFGRSRNSRMMSSAASPEKQPPQHESPSFENRRQQGTLRT